MLRAGFITTGAVLLSIAALTACGNSSSSSTPTATKAGTCQQLSAVLGDGPDSDADPIGHAEAQIIPLRRIHTGDDGLQQAITKLSSAYATYSADSGNSSSAHTLADAVKHLDAICPGAVE
jgi:hypothetical protein